MAARTGLRLSYPKRSSYQFGTTPITSVHVHKQNQKHLRLRAHLGVLHVEQFEYK
jgi:hypothetical protein